MELRSRRRPSQREAAEKYRKENVEPFANQLMAMMPELGSANPGESTFDVAQRSAEGEFPVASEDLKKLAQLLELVEHEPKDWPEDLQAFSKDERVLGTAKQDAYVRRKLTLEAIPVFETIARKQVKKVLRQLTGPDAVHKQMLEKVYPDDDAREQVVSLSAMQADREKLKEAVVLKTKLENLKQTKVIAERNLAASQTLQTRVGDLKKIGLQLTADLKGVDTWEKVRKTLEKEKNFAQTELDQVRGHLNTFAKEEIKLQMEGAQAENTDFNNRLKKAGGENEKGELRGELDGLLKDRQTELEAIQADLKNEADDAKKAGRKPDPQTQKLLGDLNSNLDRIRGRRDKLKENERNVYAYDLTYDAASGTLAGNSTNQSQGGAGMYEELQRQ